MHVRSTAYHEKVILNCYSYINSKIKILFSNHWIQCQTKRIMLPVDLRGNLEKIKRQHLMLYIYTQMNYEF